jgi:hypothetical protein
MIVLVVILTLFGLLTIVSVIALILTRKQTNYSPEDYQTKSTERAKTDVSNYIKSNHPNNNGM